MIGASAVQLQRLPFCFNTFSHNVLLCSAATITASVVFEKSLCKWLYTIATITHYWKGTSIFPRGISSPLLSEYSMGVLHLPMSFPCISFINDMDLNWVISIVYLITWLIFSLFYFQAGKWSKSPLEAKFGIQWGPRATQRGNRC